MTKSPVPQKILDLCELYVKRMDSELSPANDDPEKAVFWATMVHSLFALSKAMGADGQIHPEVFMKINKLESRAEKILTRIGPIGLSGDARESRVLQAYSDFRQDAEMLGLL